MSTLAKHLILVGLKQGRYADVVRSHPASPAARAHDLLQTLEIPEFDYSIRLSRLVLSQSPYFEQLFGGEFQEAEEVCNDR